MNRFLLALFLAVAPTLTLADAANPLSPGALISPTAPAASPSDVQAEQKSVQAWGREHAECGEWSDGCVACTKDGCSTPGIACTPKEIACRRK